MNNNKADRYRVVTSKLREIRESLSITQTSLALLLNKPQSYVAKIETSERRIDIVELKDWLDALNFSFGQFINDIGWTDEATPKFDKYIYPLPRTVKATDSGISVKMNYPDGNIRIELTDVTVDQFKEVDAYLTTLYRGLNTSTRIKNREAICQALEFAISKFSYKANPSDIYQHIVYRTYLREYNKSDPEQSWRRAGGEAVELFVENHYKDRLLEHDIKIVALISRQQKEKALHDMNLSNIVGGSKLDVVLYGKHNSDWVVFGGIHCKASLAERISDDIPTSRTMMNLNLLSLLYTFDSKSYPPPTGDLTNKGEFGTSREPSDKRTYIESHGAFDACFCYNLRTQPSKEFTQSNKKIFVSSLDPRGDQMIDFICNHWNRYKSGLK